MSQTPKVITLMGYYDLPLSIQKQLKEAFYQRMWFDMGYLRGFLEKQFQKLGLDILHYEGNLKATDEFDLKLVGSYDKAVKKDHQVFQQLSKDEQKIIEKIKKKYQVGEDHPYLTASFTYSKRGEPVVCDNLITYLEQDGLTTCFMRNIVKQCQFKEEDLEKILSTLKKFHHLQEQHLMTVLDTLHQLIKGMVEEIIEIWFYQMIEEELGEIWYDETGKAYHVEEVADEKIKVQYPKDYQVSGEDWNKKEVTFLKRITIRG